MRRKRSLWDLVDDEKTGRIQTSKVWLNIGNLIATVLMLRLPVEQIESDVLGVYMTAVTVGYGGMYYLTGKRKQDAAYTHLDTGEDALSEARRDSAFVAGDGDDYAQGRPGRRSGTIVEGPRGGGKGAGRKSGKGR